MSKCYELCSVSPNCIATFETSDPDVRDGEVWRASFHSGYYGSVDMFLISSIAFKNSFVSLHPDCIYVLCPQKFETNNI